MATFSSTLFNKRLSISHSFVMTLCYDGMLWRYFMTLCYDAMLWQYVGALQAADVGIGINGLEGTQAVCAADYAISQFRFLKKLLLVHGMWNYYRICKLVLYSFYKNICLYVIEVIINALPRYSRFSDSFARKSLIWLELWKVADADSLLNDLANNKQVCHVSGAFNIFILNVSVIFLNPSKEPWLEDQQCLYSF